MQKQEHAFDSTSMMIVAFAAGQNRTGTSGRLLEAMVRQADGSATAGFRERLRDLEERGMLESSPGPGKEKLYRATDKGMKSIGIYPLKANARGRFK